MSTPPTSAELEQLLRIAAGAARDGNQPAARALLRALSREYPDDPRVWAGLASVAASPDERREALEQTVALDPENEVARAALDELRAAERPTALLPETILARADVDSVAPAAEREPAPPPDEEAAEPPRFPLLNLIAGAIILALLAAVGLVIGQALLGGAAPAAQLTPVLQPTPAQLTPAQLTPAQPTPVLQPTAAQPTAAPPTAAPPTAAGPAPGAPLPLGTVLDVDGWSATLLRPDYALLLDGAIGGLQPSGRFVLALMAVSNNSPSARRIPPDLFVLTDAQGRRFAPAPGASSAYLAAYGRGQYGELALEDDIAPQSGMRSVPLLFDVPLDATGLTLTVADAAGAGWPIEGAPQLPAGP